MKWIIIAAIAITAASALPDKLPQARAARRGRQRLRAGRQEPDNLYAAPSEEIAAADTGYGAPPVEAPAEYGASESDVVEYDNEPAASDDIGTSYGAPEEPEEEITEEELAPPAEYGVPDDQASYESDQDAAASDVSDDAVDPLAMLMKSVPGIPGEDYPIFAEAPETGFSCDGQVNGGYYADDEAQCQVFHICAANAEGGLAKYSFLCPNGTIFNQEYFICDWWFNVDCAEAAALAESRNAAIAAERSEVDARNAEESLSADESAPIASYEAESGAEEAPSSYGAALDEAASETLPSYAEQPSYSSRRRF